ncbi:MAG TPA: hypothetical protein VMV72_15200 [Verrucomicrobiae bacterium]|nr:hypothetical protein [Verrucomicrobiae bacterium]
MKINHRLRFATDVLCGLIAVSALLGFTGVAQGVGLTWTNGDDVWTSTTAWTTNVFSGIDTNGLTNVTCVAGGYTLSNTTACIGGTGGYPGGDDHAYFTNSSTYTVTINTPTTVSDVSFRSNTTGVVTLDASGNTLTVTGQFQVGDSTMTAAVYWAGGTLDCENGGQAQTRIAGGSSATAAFFVTNGVVIFDAAGNYGTSKRGLQLGGGSGKLVITAPGVVTNGVNGVSSYGTFSLGANCQLIITNGGKLFVTGYSRLGDGSNALTLISGPTSLFSNTVGGIIVNSASTLIVSNGATLFTMNGGTIGGGTSMNTGIVCGAGSRLISQGGGTLNFIVGTSSAGSTNNDFLVYNGGFFDDSGGTLAYGNAVGLTNTIHFGGTGAMSTGYVACVRAGSSAMYCVAYVTNAVLSTGQLSVNGSNGQAAVILAGGSLVVTNDPSLVKPPAITTNVVDYSAGGGSYLTINSGTLIAATGSNSTQFVFGDGSISYGDILTLTNRGKLLTEQVLFGGGIGNHTGIVDGVGTVWSNVSVLASSPTNGFTIGAGGGGSNNYFVIRNGATLYNNGTLSIANNATGVYNTVVFGGVGPAVTIVNIGSLNVGGASGTYGNTLTITNATVNTGTLNVGNSGATNNLLVLEGATMSFDFMRVRSTNTLTFSSGTINAGAATVDSLANNGTASVLGDGVGAAYYNMTGTGSGYHNFNSGVVITNGAVLSGNGTLCGNATILGSFVPGFSGSVGSIYASNDLTFGSSAALYYDLGTSSDSVTVNGDLTLGGILEVSNSGGFGVGTYVLFTHTNTVTAPAGTLTVDTGSLPAGLTAIISNDVPNTPRVLLVVSAVVTDPYTTWQQHYFPSDGPNSLGTANPTGDGMNNTNKFLAGFNPTNGPAYLHIISVAKQSTNVVVTYLGASGDNSWSPGIASRTNVLEFTTGTANGSYTNNFVSTGQTNALSGGTGFGQVTSFIDTNGAASGSTRYYRVRVLLP